MLQQYFRLNSIINLSNQALETNAMLISAVQYS